MRLRIATNETSMIEIDAWNARSPEYFVEHLAQQLEAAKAIWPELADHRISDRIIGPTRFEIHSEDGGGPGESDHVVARNADGKS